MPVPRLDGQVWTHLWRAIRGWIRRAFGRMGLPPLPPAGSPAAPRIPTEEPGPEAIAERASTSLDVPHAPVPAAPPPLLPATGLGPYARATWMMRWRPPLLRVACPRCQAPLQLPLWKVLCYEDVFCEVCALRLRRSTSDEPIQPRS